MSYLFYWSRKNSWLDVSESIIFFWFSLLLHLILFLCNIGPYYLQSLTKFQWRGGKTFSRLSWIFTEPRSFQQKFYRMRRRWISGRVLNYCKSGTHHTCSCSNFHFPFMFTIKEFFANIKINVYEFVNEMQFI